MCEIDSAAVIRENLVLACRADPAGEAALLALPRAWVLSRFDAAAEPLLASGDPEHRRRLADLRRRLDPPPDHRTCSSR